jgi:hypothetical protein
MSSSRPTALLLALALPALLGLGCARTALEPECALGMTLEGDRCVCATDQGCPVGFGCEAGVCVCRDTGCCPEGYEYAEDSRSCVCRDDACCPADHRWEEAEGRCVCDSQSCCPAGYTFDTAAGGCRCSVDQCCPTGFIYSAQKQQCVCNADACCPLDHRFDQATGTCVCAKDSCCPLGYTYNQSIGACVCSGNSCCPAGFRYDVGTNRCVCINDQSCNGGVNNYCDAASGACKCRNDLGCPQTPVPQYCNGLGFCQSLACTSNRDCPSSSTNPLFCDVTSSRCISTAFCTLDDHCPFGQVCDTGLRQCRAGCRRDEGCARREACVNGSCAQFCRSSEYCPQANQFCTTSTGTCATRSGRVDCFDCTSNPGICGSGGVCLVFVAEGQNQRSFCGMYCNQQQDCPSGYDCGGVIYPCSSEGASCPSDPDFPGETMVCRRFLVENEGERLFCSDGSLLPHEYYRACAPSSGFCPASPAP